MNQLTSIALALLVLGIMDSATAQELTRQLNNADVPQAMTDEELGELGDPLFLLFLKDQSDKVRLSELEQAVQPSADKRQLFVVDERIIDATRPQSRRAVITFEGQNDGIDLKGNVMLSLIFSDTEFRDDAFIEALGWDKERRRYNYYRMDQGSWKFRGSSEDRELSGVGGTCFACHVNGAPIMKELLIPWNHWHSRSSAISYFDRLQPASRRWPIADDPRFDNLEDAALLDLQVRSSIANFNSSRILSSRQDDAVTDARSLLSHVFLTTEFNIISARVKSNLHPLSTDARTQPSESFGIPASFFLNAAIIEGGGLSGFQNGFALDDFRSFQSDDALKVTPEEYADLVDEFDLQIDDKPGDADFAWLVPEPSDLDNHMIDRLIGEKIVPAHYVAAVMAIDLRTPILSDDRASLLTFVPDRFETSEPTDGDPSNTAWFEQHDLTGKTIDMLTSTDLTDNPVAREFLDILTSANGRSPIEELASRVSEYATEVRRNLSGPDRELELRRLFSVAIDRRKAVQDHPTLGHLDETGGKLLFPEAPG